MSKNDRRGEKPHDGSTDDQPTDHSRRAFMAAGVSAAAAAMLPTGQPLDLDAWPSEDEINPPTADAETGRREVYRVDADTVARAEDRHTAATLPNPPTFSDVESEIIVRYDHRVIWLFLNADLSPGRFGTMVKIAPTAAERLAAQLEAAAVDARGPDSTGVVAGEFADTTFHCGLLGAVFEADDVEAAAHRYMDGVCLDLSVRSPPQGVEFQTMLGDDAVEIAKALRIAVAEWRRWPITGE